MGNPDLAALASRLGSMAQGLQDPELRSHTQPIIEQIVKRVVSEEVSADLGPDLSFSGMPESGPLSLDVDPSGEGSTSIAPPGVSELAWRLATNGRHTGNRGQTAGFGTFDRITDRLADELPGDVLDAIREDMVNRFG